MLRLRFVLVLLIWPVVTSFAAMAATTYSNGTGGGDFLTGSTWVGGVAPGQTGGASGNTAGWTVAVGDNVIMDGNVNITDNLHPKVKGALTLLPGAVVQASRYNYGISANSVLNIFGGYLSVDRFEGTGSEVINITGGSLKSKTSLGSIVGSKTLYISGGNLDLSTSGGATLQAIIHLSGNGSILLTNNANNGDISGFSTASSTWNGGTVYLNTAYNGGGNPSNARYFSAYYPFLLWKTSDNNLLQMTSGNSAVVAGDGSTASYPLFSSLGTMGFNIYSATNNDCDKFDWDNGTNSLSLDSGVDIQMSGYNLSGNVLDYIGKSYKIFQLNNHTNITPTLRETRVSLGGISYKVTWTNNLAVDGSLTIAGFVGNTGALFMLE